MGMNTEKRKLNPAEVFGQNVFNENKMKELLPKATFKELKKTLDFGAPLSKEVADVVANAMKDWALERGATHYTHWFQPLTGITAEKHDSFIAPSNDGTIIMEFSGKQLVQGEPDASSFPSGGLRATFEARGYTAWDPTSPCFLKEDNEGDVTLYIPTAFYSYTGVALDKKIPVLRSMDQVSKHALRILKALGNQTTKKVTATLGPEQEYFLVDKEYFINRIDLIMTGRTLFGAPSPKGQELEDQYFGPIKDRVSAYMTDLDEELWKLGVLSKTRHNEVAPAQFENAPVFSMLNLAIDHNQLVMDTMQKIALRHGLVCLLHEKPYRGINGSGKHNNWSLSTDDGQNLLEPGETPHDNMQFLIFLAALIQCVDKHADLLRGACASAGQDHRLGANEAPPAIISIFLGDMITEILEKIVKGEKFVGKGVTFLNMGVDLLPKFPLDNSDRNRTSPFAFTGNKFEFRMVGSAQSCSGPNIILNTIAAESFDEIATRLEKSKDAAIEVIAIIKDVMKAHSKVIFNGNGYSAEWEAEATKRGLPNVKNSVDAQKAFTTQKAKDLFKKYSVLSNEELHSRYEVYIEQYAKIINIEALTAIKMVKTLYMPAVIMFTSELADTVNGLKTAGASASVQSGLLKNVTSLLENVSNKLASLETALAKAQDTSDSVKKSEAYRDTVYTTYTSLRDEIDALEAILPAEIWPVPTYAEMLFNL
jgi:glutamine synthetase